MTVDDLNTEHLTLKNVLYVYRLNVKDHGVLEHQLAGRLLVHGSELEVLSDYFGALGMFPRGPMDDKSRRRLAALLRNPYFETVSAEDLQNGLRPDLLPVHEPASVPPEQEAQDDFAAEPAPQRPPSLFQYSHPALSQPVDLSVQGDQFHFNGQQLSPVEIQRLMANIKSGTAQIRYKKDAVQKMESVFEDLMKIEPRLQDALGKLRAAHRAGAIDKNAYQSLTREIFGDPMVPGVGNKKAFADMLSRPRQGVHIRLDGNSFGQINKIHSFEHGDHAIKAMGSAIRQAADESVGRSVSKIHRIGGDEFNILVPTHEHAAALMRNLRAKLEAIPPIGGTHQLSVSAGIGMTPELADQASIKAKQAKKASGLAVGQEKTHVHSLVPGFEGPVPVSPEQLPIAKPKDAFAVPSHGSAHVGPLPSSASDAVPVPASSPAI